MIEPTVIVSVCVQKGGCNTAVPFQIGGHDMPSSAARQQESEAFSADVARKLKTYVYRLIDPRNGETFYVGKVQGNRVVSHIRPEQSLEGDEVDNKLKRIREIRLAGFEVAHVIHRHGMDERTAFEVEAALIDAYPGDAVPGRFGFVGREAPADISGLYVGKRVPDTYRKRGAANPIKYTW